MFIYNMFIYKLPISCKITSPDSKEYIFFHYILKDDTIYPILSTEFNLGDLISSPINEYPALTILHVSYSYKGTIFNTQTVKFKTQITLF